MVHESFAHTFRHWHIARDSTIGAAIPRNMVFIGVRPIRNAPTICEFPIARPARCRSLQCFRMDRLGRPGGLRKPAFDAETYSSLAANDDCVSQGRNFFQIVIPGCDLFDLLERLSRIAGEIFEGRRFAHSR